MFLQIIGALIVVLSCSIFGICWGAKISYRIQELEQIQRAMTMLQNQIDFLSQPLPEAMEEIGIQCHDIAGELFLNTANEMNQIKWESGGEIWQKCVLDWKEKSYLQKQDIDNLLCFGKSMECCNVEQQKSSIALLLHNIEITLSQLHEKKKQQQKLYSSMGVLTGLLVVIMLL